MHLTLGYVRVSTVEQEQGFGREVQAERIRRYAADKGIGPVEIYYESKSGESILNRLELHTTLARAEAAADDSATVHVIFYSLDRLTRDLIDQESLVTRCFGKGIRLHSTQEAENDTLDPAYAGDPMRVAIRQFFGIIHQLDKAIIQRRMDGGLARKAAGGGFAGGRIPFGYRSVNRDLQIDPDEAEPVRRALTLKTCGMDLATIAGLLASQYPEKCSAWTKQTVSRLLSRRDLYERGIYQPRGAATAVARPDLIICDAGTMPAKVDVSTKVDIDRLPDPISIDALAIIVGKTPEELQSFIASRGLMLRWAKGRAMAPPSTVVEVLGQNA